MAKLDSAQFVRGGRRYGYLVLEPQEPATAPVLTPAERDVASLVARGCSNRQIAEERQVSVHTVGNQLAAIYDKLGVSSRHELVDWLSRATARA